MSLNDLKGVQIGIFGQDQHWKIDTGLKIKNCGKSQIISKNLSTSPNTEKPSKSAKSNKSSVNFKEDIQNENNQEINEPEIITNLPPYVGQPLQLFTALNENLNIEPTFEYEDDAFIRNTDLRYNPWSKTILGFFKVLIGKFFKQFVENFKFF